MQDYRCHKWITEHRQRNTSGGGKAWQRFQGQLVQGVLWQEAKQEVPFLKWDGGILETGGPSTFQVPLEFQDPV